MRTINVTEKLADVETSSAEQYGYVAANFAAIAQKNSSPEDEYTAALVNLLDNYPSHFHRRRTDGQNTSAGMIIRKDVDAIMGISCPLTVEEVGRLFARFIQDDCGVELVENRFNPASRAAVLALVHCIDQYSRPTVV